jgi:hypothetical protein
MKSYWHIVTLALCIVTNSSSGQVLSDSDLVLGKLAINGSGDSTSFSAMFGKPDSVSRFTDDHRYATPVTFTTFYFDSVTICIGDQGIQSIETVGTLLATHRGVRVGERVELVESLYGPPSITDLHDCDGLQYFWPDSALGLTFCVSDGRVVKIFIGYWSL